MGEVPFCGWHWKRIHTGKHAKEHGITKEAKGEFTFEKVDPQNDAFISIRNTPGGRGNPDSFKEVGKITLQEAKNMPEYKDLINSLRQKIRIIKQILEE